MESPEVAKKKTNRKTTTVPSQKSKKLKGSLPNDTTGVSESKKSKEREDIVENPETQAKKVKVSTSLLKFAPSDIGKCDIVTDGTHLWIFIHPHQDFNITEAKFEVEKIQISGKASTFIFSRSPKEQILIARCRGSWIVEEVIPGKNAIKLGMEK